MRAVGAKRPRGLIAAPEQASIPWAGRVPKPAMDADSFVDYGSGFLRKSCDSCVSSKRRCDGQDPCTRCLRRKKPCHYTERKKCGPRSGQKTSKGPRRARLASSPDPATPTGPAQHHTAEQHQQCANGTHHRLGVAGTPTCSERVPDFKYRGLRLGPSPQAHAILSPPPHANPSLSPDELSGETTCVDYTDCSDGPPPQHALLRDESGSSWWSLEDQTTTATSSLSGAAATAAWVQQQQQEQQRGRYVRGDAHYNSSHLGQGDDHWGGMRSSGANGGVSGSGGSGGSAGSAGDSSDDDDSEERLGQAEEEVAALLIRLGKTDSFFEGFTDDETTNGARSPVDREPEGGMARSREPQRCWGVGDLPGRAQ